VNEGPYSGYRGEEPDYELWAGWGPLIGQADPGAVVVLSDTVDRLGLDSNEASWVIALVMECYEKKMLTKSDTEGIEMTWGNVEGTRQMLHKIATRDGFGSLLADGVMQAARKIGGKAPSMAVYVRKGHAPRNHDHRARWLEMVDTATSDCGTIAVGPQPVEDHTSMESIVSTLTAKRIRSFVDSLVVCAFPSMTMTESKIDYLVQMLNSITPWEYSEEQALETALRIDNVLRAFNVRHGLTPDLEVPSLRYGSGQVDGPVKAESVMPCWDQLLDKYYEAMGWDRDSGKPSPQTLKKLDLTELIDDLWR
jgi:aldehyde:ferredoxin oxidoreductase